MLGDQVPENRKRGLARVIEQEEAFLNRVRLAIGTRREIRTILASSGYRVSKTNCGTTIFGAAAVASALGKELKRSLPQVFKKSTYFTIEHSLPKLHTWSCTLYFGKYLCTLSQLYLCTFFTHYGGFGFFLPINRQIWPNPHLSTEWRNDEPTARIRKSKLYWFYLFA